MLEDLINDTRFRRYFPPVAGLLFAALFVNLGLWQLDRAAEKRALLAAFESGESFRRPPNFENLQAFERIEVSGRYLGEKQVLIDNIVHDGAVGYYVITPFRLSANSPLLLVNRGWKPKDGNDPAAGIDIESTNEKIRGLAGNLPQVGIRPGEAFAGSNDWPRIAVYPNLQEVARQLEAELQPRVLLLAAGEPHGFVRDWQPNVSGPMTHYSYAFQWFAMATAVLALLYWHHRKRKRTDDKEPE